MPINQPPITKGDHVRSSWDLEVTNLLNQLELQVQQNSLANAVAPATTPAGEAGIGLDYGQVNPNGAINMRRAGITVDGGILNGS